ncbi:class I SAM-dependent methyltransferase [Thermomonas aquatica]|nr:methyltransferase domain-containing protein [Thermomonas aquatica]
MNQALLRFDDLAARKDDPALFARWLFSGSLAERPHGLDGMQFRCSLCMAVTRMARREGVEDLREGMPCATCGMSARLRSCLAMLGTLVEPSDRIYITEQGTPAFAWLQARYPHVRGSEFEPDADRRAALAAYLESLGGHGPIEFQDVTRLDMADDSLHAVACFDVLEHVPDYRAALREFARVLRAGGHLLATFPFTDGPDTVVRASLSPQGEVVHHMEPEYHGDPVGGAVLCFQHFGWDVLAAVREAGLAHAEMVMPWSPEHGLLYGNWMLLARKTG